jgi:hypothetical protein
MTEGPFPPTTSRPSATQLQAFSRSVANAAALPESGTFVGQRVWLIDVEEHATWTGSAWTWPATWVVTATDTDITGTDLIAIGGMKFTAAVQSTKDVFLVTITADVRLNSASVATSISLFRNGAVVPGGQIVQGGSKDLYGTPSKVWRVTGLAPGDHTFEACAANFLPANATVTANSQMHVQRL